MLNTKKAPKNVYGEILSSLAIFGNIFILSGGFLCHLEWFLYYLRTFLYILEVLSIYWGVKPFTVFDVVFPRHRHRQKPGTDKNQVTHYRHSKGFVKTFIGLVLAGPFESVSVWCRDRYFFQVQVPMLRKDRKKYCIVGIF